MTTPLRPVAIPAPDPEVGYGRHYALAEFRAAVEAARGADVVVPLKIWSIVQADLAWSADHFARPPTPDRTYNLQSAGTPVVGYLAASYEPGDVVFARVVDATGPTGELVVGAEGAGVPDAERLGKWKAARAALYGLGQGSDVTAAAETVTATTGFPFAAVGGAVAVGLLLYAGLALYRDYRIAEAQATATRLQNIETTRIRVDGRVAQTVAVEQARANAAAARYQAIAQSGRDIPPGPAETASPIAGIDVPATAALGAGARTWQQELAASAGDAMVYGGVILAALLGVAHVGGRVLDSVGAARTRAAIREAVGSRR